MKVTIEDGCIGCGACESFCQDVFKVEDACPVSVISVAEQLNFKINNKNGSKLV